jgi:hypothetical protein
VPAVQAAALLGCPKVSGPIVPTFFGAVALRVQQSQTSFRFWRCLPGSDAGAACHTAVPILGRFICSYQQSLGPDFNFMDEGSPRRCLPRTSEAN